MVCSAQERQFEKRMFQASNGINLPYNILLPENYDSSKEYPLLLFLHGSGERGTDNEKQLIHGGKLLSTSKELLDVIVIVPQCPENQTWAPSKQWAEYPSDAPQTAPATAVLELIDGMIAKGQVNLDRIYGAGLSMGAMGILDLTLRRPNFFKAVSPICGNVNLERVRKYYGRTAFRLYHGIDDKVVDPKGSLMITAILYEHGFEADLICYAGVGHGSWYNAFAEKDFLSWILKH